MISGEPRRPRRSASDLAGSILGSIAEDRQAAQKIVDADREAKAQMGPQFSGRKAEQPQQWQAHEQMIAEKEAEIAAMRARIEKLDQLLDLRAEVRTLLLIAKIALESSDVYTFRDAVLKMGDAVPAELLIDLQTEDGSLWDQVYASWKGGADRSKAIRTLNAYAQRAGMPKGAKISEWYVTAGQTHREQRQALVDAVKAKHRAMGEEQIAA